MPDVTFQVIDGVDKGRVFRNLNLAAPITIGREEGNGLRLNDERVSRFHAKIQLDNQEVILTDLDSTNGTKVNGQVVQIRRLRVGDRVSLGRSTLLFGSEAEIRERMENVPGLRSDAFRVDLDNPEPTILGNPAEGSPEACDFELSLKTNISGTSRQFYAEGRPLPPLPEKLTPSQAARLAELLDFLHLKLTQATENIQANEENTQICLSYADWQRVLGIEMLLAKYVRGVTDPDVLAE